MSGSPMSEHAELLCKVSQKISKDSGLRTKIPEFFLKILECVSFAASKLKRQGPCLRDFRYEQEHKLCKKARSANNRFFHKGYDDLIGLCFFELITLVPDSEKPWTDNDAALFLLTLESINPSYSTLFTMVFDSLIGHTDLKNHFEKWVGDYSKYPTHFSDSVFKSLWMVVRPKSSFKCPEEIVQGYGLQFHYLYPIARTSNQRIQDLHQEFSTVVGTEF